MRVETGSWLDGLNVLMSPMGLGGIIWTRQLLSGLITKKQVRKDPEIDTRKHEVAQYGHYGYRNPRDRVFAH